MLKYLPKHLLKKKQKNYSFLAKKILSYRENIERRMHNSNTVVDITNENIEDIINRFADVIITDKVYRIPLRYFCDRKKYISQ